MVEIHVPGNFRFFPSYDTPNRVHLQWAENGQMDIYCPKYGGPDAAMMTGWIAHGRHVVLSLPGVVISSSPGREGK